MNVQLTLAFAFVAVVCGHSDMPLQPVEHKISRRNHGALSPLEKRMCMKGDSALCDWLNREDEVPECKEKVEKIQAQINILNNMMDSTYNYIRGMDDQLDERESKYRRDTIQQCLTGVEDICQRYSQCCNKAEWTCNRVQFTVHFDPPFHTKPQRAAVNVVSYEAGTGQVSYDAYFDESWLQATEIRIRFEPYDKQLNLKHLKIRWMACA